MNCPSYVIPTNHSFQPNPFQTSNIRITSCPDLGGGGYPHPVLTRGVPHPVLPEGGTLSQMGVTPPPPSAGWGISLSLDGGTPMGWVGYPLLAGGEYPPQSDGWGYPPPEMWTDRRLWKCCLPHSFGMRAVNVCPKPPDFPSIQIAFSTDWLPLLLPTNFITLYGWYIILLKGIYSQRSVFITSKTGRIFYGHII